jgi:hypothetical protein
VFLQYSDDGGANWCPPVQVDDATSGTRFLPKLALDQTTGFLGVSYYDTRNDPTNKSPEFFMAFSTNGGRSFEPNIQLTNQPSNVLPKIDGSFDYGDYTGATYDHGVYHPAWADNSLTFEDNPGEMLDIVTITAQPGTFTTQEDSFEPNETSDRASNMGLLNLGDSQTIPSLTITRHANNLPDYDWFRWQPAMPGIFTVSFTVGETAGDLELHLFTINKDGTLVELGSTTSGLSGSCIASTPAIQAAVSSHQPMLVEVKGVESSPGKWGVGFYDLTVSLT